MSVGQIPSFQLFSWNPYVKPTTSSSGGLTAYSSYDTPATAFSPSYPVNAPPIDGIQYNFSNYLAVGGNGQLITKSIGQAQIPSTTLQFDFNSPTALTNAVIPTTIPDIPQQFATQIQTLFPSEPQLQNLLSQPSFIIPIEDLGANGLFGIQYTTDGQGNIISSQLVRDNQPVDLNPTLVPNVSTLAEGAVFKVSPGSPSSSTGSVSPATTTPAASPAILPETAASPPSTGIFSLSNVEAKPAILPDRLASPYTTAAPVYSAGNSPASNNLSIFGSSIAGNTVPTATPANIRQVATSQAAFGITLPANVQTQIQSLLNNNLAVTPNPTAENLRLSMNLASGRLPLSFPLPASGANTTSSANPLINLDQSAASAGGNSTGLNLNQNPSGMMMQTGMQSFGQSFLSGNLSGGLGQEGQNRQRRRQQPQLAALA